MSETTCQTINIATPKAPVDLPGYELLEKIGAGGYGEVWRALVPGGVQKAVKFVFGAVDEARGASELKSLERIKDARHPFLLVLERFDIIDGRLVIVTELAEGSLKDRLDDCRAKGKPGIPRNELLGFLRDTADALDFMYEKHRLAHLDIKPENLLLVGGRAKVADFGLTKDITNLDHSMMSGLTPQFAAPEMFEGRASRQSDQYSLAIVYQLLLTGQSPFNGRTAAQLTAQHLHSAPSLAPLPPSDRAAISRALSKKANARFESCREFIDDLLDRSARRRPAAPKASSRPGRSRTVSAEDVPAQIALRFGQSTPPATRDTYRPAATVPESAARPTLVIGIGGIGRRILTTMNCAEHVRPMLVDIDATAIADFRRTVSKIDSLAIPLRTSAEYRKQSSRWLEWIDRRWLYNVPRSMQTEGIRPLGRLACLDNEATLADHVRHQFGELQSRHPNVDPIVYVVGASSGGTASGSLIDVAEIVRKTAESEGLNVDCRAVVVHAKRVNTVNGDLADANTVSLLSELRLTAKIRQIEVDTEQESLTGFSQVHLVDAGDTNDEEQVDRALLTARCFLERATTGKVGGVLEADAASDRHESPMLGSLGFAPIPGVTPERIDEMAGRVTDACHRYWTGSLTVEYAERLPGAAVGVLKKLHLAADEIDARVEASIAESGGSLEAAIEGSLIGDSAAVHVAKAESFLATSDEEPNEDDPAYLLSLVRKEHVARNRGTLAELATMLGKVVERPGQRLAAPLGMIEALKGELRATIRTLTDAVTSTHSRVEARRTALDAPPSPDESAETRWQAFLRERVRLAITMLWLDAVSEIESQLDEIEARFRATSDALPYESETAEHAIPGPMLEELDRRVQAILDSRGERFGKLLNDDPDVLRGLVSRTAQGIATESLVGAAMSSGGANGLDEFVGRTFAAARPHLPVRGAVRLVLVVPSAGLAKALVPKGVSPVVVVDPEATPGVLWITSGVPYAHAATRFVGDRPTVLQLADRLHTRTDVDWRA